jgi:uncharacterized protein (UPF0333 family)
VGDKKMRLSRTAQVSMEYMILVGFLLVVTIPLILVYNTQYKGTNQQIIANQADQLGQKIVDTAESIYYLGQPSKTTIKVYIPQQIEGITLVSNEITFRILANRGGINEVVKLSSVPINGTISSTPGLHYITVQSVGSYVNLSST